MRTHEPARSSPHAPPVCARRLVVKCASSSTAPSCPRVLPADLPAGPAFGAFRAPRHEITAGNEKCPTSGHFLRFTRVVRDAYAGGLWNCKISIAGSTPAAASNFSPAHGRFPRVPFGAQTPVATIPADILPTCAADSGALPTAVRLDGPPAGDTPDTGRFRPAWPRETLSGRPWHRFHQEAPECHAWH